MPNLKPTNPFLAVVVVNSLLRSSDGRDKILKLVQYYAKLLLISTYRKELSVSAQSRVVNLASAFGSTRRILRMGSWIDSLCSTVDLIVPSTANALSISDLLSHGTSPAQKQDLAISLGTKLIQIANGLSEDISCLSRIGVIDAKYADIFEPISSRLWFTLILIEMNKTFAESARLRNAFYVAREKYIEKSDVAVRNEMNELDKNLLLANVSLVKLLSDLSFCSYDVFNLGSKGVPDSIQVYAGCVSAVLAVYKAWNLS